MLDIFAVKRVATAFQCGCNDDRVIPSQAVFSCYPQSLDIESRRGMNVRPGSLRSPLRYRLHRELTGPPSWPWRARGSVEYVNEHVGIEKEFTAHSSHPAYNDPPNERVGDGAQAHRQRRRHPLAQHSAPAIREKLHSASYAANVLAAEPAQSGFRQRLESHFHTVLDISVRSASYQAATLCKNTLASPSAATRTAFSTPAALSAAAGNPARNL